MNELVLNLSIFFSIVRILAVVVGLGYQSIVTRDRRREKYALCSDPSAPKVECAISLWHYERGVLLLAVHALLGVLTGAAFWGRIKMPPPENLNTEILLLRIIGDLVFTLVVVLLAVVSFRAHVHHLRQLKMLRGLE